MSDIETVDPELWKRRCDLAAQIELSQIYHRKRERTLDLVDRGGKAMALLAGSALVAQITMGWSAVVLGTLAAIPSAFSLVFSLSERARKHAELAVEYGRLAAILAKCGTTNFTDHDLDECDAKLQEIQAIEPPTLPLLIVLCQNEQFIARGQLERVVRVGPIKRLTADFISWDTTDLGAVS